MYCSFLQNTALALDLVITGMEGSWLVVSCLKKWSTSPSIRCMTSSGEASKKVSISGASSSQSTYSISFEESI